MLLKDAPPSSTPFSFRTFLPLILFFCLVIGMTYYVASMRKKGEIEHTATVFMPEVRLSLEGDEMVSPPPVAGKNKGISNDVLLPSIPNADQSYLLAGRAMDGGNHAAAEELLRNALVFYPKEIKLYTLISISLFQQKKLPEAESVLRRLLFLQPSDLLTCRNLAMVLGQRGKYSEAVTVLLQALRHLPKEDDRNRGEIYRQLSLMYAGSFLRSEAIDSLRNAGRLLGGRQVLDTVQDPLFDFMRDDPELHQIFQELSERRKKE